MKKTKLLAALACLFLTNLTFAERIINWERSGGGRKGYDKVSQTYVGQTSPGNDQVYNIKCTDPGREPCRFSGIAANPNNIDDWAVNISRRFFDGMHDDIDVASENASNGEWRKTIESTYMGQSVRIYVTSTWSKTIEGEVLITTRINPVQL